MGSAVLDLDNQVLGPHGADGRGVIHRAVDVEVLGSVTVANPHSSCAEHQHRTGCAVWSLHSPNLRVGGVK